jgi:hypothetical protein
MNTRIIYRGEEIEVPSFHATRLINNGRATLPKVKPRGNLPRERETQEQEQAAVAAPESDAVSTETTAETESDVATRRQYRRRDMKAQD